jgi:hypothetical protein
MKRSEVKDFIQSGAELLNIPFETGRITEFNSSRSNTYPFIFLESINVLTSMSYSLPTDTWKIRIHVAYKDAVDSKMDQYENLIDDADDVAKSLVKRYNDILTNYNLVTISGISRTPFIKKHADCLTGVLLAFDLIAQDVNGCD